MSLHMLNPNADQITSDTLEINIRAAVGLKEILKTNLGPLGKLKMLVSGSGDITLTKHGSVLLKNMQIEHPTASLIAKNAATQDDIAGDGTTSLIIFIGELLHQCLFLASEGVHPRILSEGIEIARRISIDFLRSFATDLNNVGDRELLCTVARSTLRTKLKTEVADHLTGIVVDAVKTVRIGESPIDLFMIEVMCMEHKSQLASRLVRGLVLDHGFRHPSMPKRSENCHILILNDSLEYEKTEVNSQFYYGDAAQRAAMVSAERDHVNSKLMNIVALKAKVEEIENEKAPSPKSSFVVINQKGIDPLSLDFLHKHGIVSLRRAKRRNMERLVLSCGGVSMNSTENLSPSCLGYAGSVTEHILGEERFTFVEDVRTPHSCTILLNGPNKYSINQMKDAVRDAQRAVKAVLEEKKAVEGAGAFEAACHVLLHRLAESGEHGKASMGIKAFSEAIFAIPRALADNSGLDSSECLLRLKNAAASNLDKSKGTPEAKVRPVGLNITDGSLISPADEGVWDSFQAKRQLLHLGAITAENLLVVDEIIRAGKVDAKKQ